MPCSTRNDRHSMTVAIESARSTFPRERLDRIALDESGHYWHAPRRKLLLDLIAPPHLTADHVERPVVDIGCGTGALVEALLARGVDAHGVDPWTDQHHPLSERFRSGEMESIPWPDGSAGIACAFDVLEHVDDDTGLREMHRILRPGGRLLLTVPAHRWLWSRRDELAGHQRRYSRSLLSKRVQDAGFHIEQLFGFQFLLLPLIGASRLGMRLMRSRDTMLEDRPASAFNTLLRTVNRAEISIGRLLRPPTGSSLVLTARKPLGASRNPAVST